MKGGFFRGRVFLMAAMLAVGLFAFGGCGGGGGGSNPVPSTQLVEVNAKAVLQSDRFSSGCVWKQVEGKSVILSDPNSVSPYFRPREEGNYHFSLFNGSSKIDDITIIAYVPSSIAVTNPNGLKNSTTNDASMDIKGSVSQRVKSVACKNLSTSKEYNGIIGDDGTFTVGSVEFIGGLNALEFIGVDDLGFLCKTGVEVTFNPSIEFVNMLKAEPYGMELNTPTAVTFSLEIYEHNERLVPKKFDVYEVDKVGAKILKVGELAKSQAEEGVFSASITISHSVEGAHYYRAFNEEDGLQMSNIASLTVIRLIPEEVVRQSDRIVDEKFNAIFPKSMDTFDEFVFERHIENLLSELSTTEGVKSATLSQEGNAVRIEFTSGAKVTVVFSIVEETNSLSGNSNSTVWLSTYNKSFIQNFIGSDKAAIFCPFEKDFASGLLSAWKGAGELIRKRYSTVKNLKNNEIRMDDYRDLGDVGIFLMESHGTVGGNSSNRTMVLSGVERRNDRSSGEQLRDQLDEQRGFLEFVKNKVFVKSVGILWLNEEGETYFIFPPFFRHYLNGKLKNALVYMIACQGLRQDDLSNAFLEAGAAGVLGYTEDALFRVTYETGNTFFENMLGGSTAGKALEEATKREGGNMLRYVGNNDLKLLNNFVPIKSYYFGQSGSYYSKTSQKSFAFVSGGMDINLLEQGDSTDFLSLNTNGKINFKDGAWLQLGGTKLKFSKDNLGTVGQYQMQKWTTNHMEFTHYDDNNKAIKTRADIVVEQTGENTIKMTVEHPYAKITVSFLRSGISPFSYVDSGDSPISRDFGASTSEFLR